MSCVDFYMRKCVCVPSNHNALKQCQSLSKVKTIPRTAQMSTTLPAKFFALVCPTLSHSIAFVSQLERFQRGDTVAEMPLQK